MQMIHQHPAAHSIADPLWFAGYDTDSDVPGETPLPRQARSRSTSCSAVTTPLLWPHACAAVEQPARGRCQLEHADCIVLSVVDSTINSAITSCTQDDLLAALTGDRASDLDRKFAATPIIQKLLLADGAMHAHVYVHKGAAGDTGSSCTTLEFTRVATFL
jgi:hypothetical protein